MLYRCQPVKGCENMALYTARYESPKGDNPQSGEFTFESAHPMNSKANVQDARFRMLDIFGKQAVSWQIVQVERAATHADEDYLQPTLDFREPEHKRKHHVVQRGTL